MHSIYTNEVTDCRVFQVDFDVRREMSSLSLKTVVVYKNVTSLMTETNLQKGGLVYWVPSTKSRERALLLRKSLLMQL